MNEEIELIKTKLKMCIDEDWNYICDKEHSKILLDYITNLQEKVEQYENPDDLTLFYMWLDEKAKDKMKQLQEENERLHIQLEDRAYEQIKVQWQDYKSRNEKALDKLYCYGEVFDSKILQQFQKEMESILQGEDKDVKDKR